MKPLTIGLPCIRLAMAAAITASVLMVPVAPAPAVAAEADVKIALSLATLLRSARTVISKSQKLINNAAVGNKGLTGKFVLAKAIENYQKRAGSDPRAVAAASCQGRLLKAQMEAIVEVMTANQATINKAGVAFKGFVPAVFGRLVNERFKAKIGREAEIKVTAPMDLVRNRKARPDKWEQEVFQSELRKIAWPKNKVFATEGSKGGRTAFRVMVPEYFGKGCLSCHGTPKGAIDITGYPKEGAKLDELAGAISITLYR